MLLRFFAFLLISTPVLALTADELQTFIDEASKSEKGSEVSFRRGGMCWSIRW